MSIRVKARVRQLTLLTTEADVTTTQTVIFLLQTQTFLKSKSFLLIVVTNLTKTLLMKGTTL